MSLIHRLAKKKGTATVTAVSLKVTDVTEQRSSSKLSTQVKLGKLCSQTYAFVQKNLCKFQSMLEENSQEEKRLWRRVVAQESSSLLIFNAFLKFIWTYIFSLN